MYNLLLQARVGYGFGYGQIIFLALIALIIVVIYNYTKKKKETKTDSDISNNANTTQINKQNVNNTYKTLTIIASGLIAVSFFLPWFGDISAFEQIKLIIQISNSFHSMNNIESKDLFNLIVMFIPTFMTLCSIIIIIYELTSINKKSNTSVLKGIIIILIIIYILSFVSETHGGDLSDLFKGFAIGFYLTLLSIVLLISTFFVEQPVPTEINQNQPIFCSKCGKKYTSSSSGKFCDECGNQL